MPTGTRPLRNRRALCLAGLALFAFALTVLHLVDRDNAGGPLSAFSVGPAAWLYRLSFWWLAALSVLTSSLVPSTARIPLGFAAIGAAFAGLVPSVGTSLVSGPDRIHAAAMLAFFIGAIIAVWITRNASLPGSRLRLVFLVLALTTTAIFIMTLVFKAGHSPAQPIAQRLLVGALLVAFAALAASYPGYPASKPEPSARS